MKPGDSPGLFSNAEFKNVARKIIFIIFQTNIGSGNTYGFKL